jgi:hypothetical protein
VEIRVNFNTNLVGLDGEEIGEDSLAKLVAGAMAASSEGDSVKMYHWATKLWDGKELLLDNSDFKAIENFIKDGKHHLTNLVRGQALNVMSTAKTKAENEKEKAKEKNKL